ncbi:DNA polymerase beta domain protein region [Candidatus Moduliflexus flocculans]|uniref:DNA polymerase beta domain protein region n=1 Tax=Candidatus Moduliflexus flocculans TaxID=1499966 RepID=A0A081BQJ2_9BACT|nr:DNA polymerase beta domain protein region [Candidatus Moduliflexus flocculans]
MNTHPFELLVHDFMLNEEVEAILLAGSRARQAHDAHSDYDLYVYLSRELPVTTRKTITDNHCSYLELNNQFWETEDDGILSDGTPIDIIYRSLDWLAGEVERVVVQHQARTGYTTCFWSNLLNSTILFDRAGRAKAIQEKYNVPYPPELQRSIIRKNYPLLKQKLPAYYHQIEKAIQRGDAVSVHHRLTELLASYFDILFAVNAYPHPGEKRLISIAKTHCAKLPERFEEDITGMIQAVGARNQTLLERVNGTLDRLDALLKHEGLFPAS